jgi:hypothetical protein
MLFDYHGVQQVNKLKLPYVVRGTARCCTRRRPLP